MALIYVPTKLDPEVVDNIKDDVEKKKIYTSRNDAINTILKKHYAGKKTKKKR